MRLTMPYPFVSIIFTFASAFVVMLWPAALEATIPDHKNYMILDGPELIFPGHITSFNWQVPDNHPVPFVVAELCPGDISSSCYTLESNIHNDGRAIVAIPSTLSFGVSRINLVNPNNDQVIATKRVTSQSGTILYQGQQVTITWTDQLEYSHVTINFCYLQSSSTTCLPIAANIINSGWLTQEIINTNLPQTFGYIEVKAYNSNQADSQIVPANIYSFTKDNAIRPESEVLGIHDSSTATPDDNPVILPSSQSRQAAALLPSLPLSQTSLPSPPQSSSLPYASANFASPVNGQTIKHGSPINMTLGINWSPADPIVCQQWFIDGQPMDPNHWTAGQFPDSSAVPCGSTQSDS